MNNLHLSNLQPGNNLHLGFNPENNRVGVINLNASSPIFNSSLNYVIYHATIDTATLSPILYSIGGNAVAGQGVISLISNTSILISDAEFNYNIVPIISNSYNFSEKTNINESLYSNGKISINAYQSIKAQDNKVEFDISDRISNDIETINHDGNILVKVEHYDFDNNTLLISNNFESSNIALPVIVTDFTLQNNITDYIIQDAITNCIDLPLIISDTKTYNYSTELLSDRFIFANYITNFLKKDLLISLPYAVWPGYDIPSLNKPSKPIHNRNSNLLHLCSNLEDNILHIGRVGCKPGNFYIPPKRKYYMRNTISVVRLPDRTPLPVTSFTISTDCDNYGWKISGNILTEVGYNLLKTLPPAYLPREIEVVINGWKFTFLVDEPNKSQSFNSFSTSFNGRSTSAWMDAPYYVTDSNVLNTPYTAQQIANLSLDGLGWYIDWDMSDWLVPSGVFSWESLSPLKKVTNIANAVDACVYTHPYEKSLRIYPRYKIKPWAWQSELTDINISNSVINDLQSNIEFEPIVNAIYVSGTTNGVLAKAYISQSSADLYANTVADILICDTDGVAARIRGQNELAKGGVTEKITAKTLLGDINHPYLPPLIEPGVLVTVNDRVVMCRGTSITSEGTQTLIFENKIYD